MGFRKYAIVLLGIIACSQNGLLASSHPWDHVERIGSLEGTIRGSSRPLTPDHMGGFLLPGELPVPSAPIRAPLTACSDLGRLDRNALFDLLPSADYRCTENIAGALASAADSTVITRLLDLVRNHTSGWARRNGVRVLGRFAGRPPTDPARILVVQTHRTEVQNALRERLQVDRNEDVLHDAIWVLDSFFYPYLTMQPLLESISRDRGFRSDLRFRAIGAIDRLLRAKSDTLSEQDITFVLESLSSDDRWIRAQAAFICQGFRDGQLTQTTRRRVIEAVRAALTREQDVVPKAWIARALDRYDGGTGHFDTLRASYERAHLPHRYENGNIAMRSGLPQTTLARLVRVLQLEQTASFRWMGSPFDTPVPGDTNGSLTVVILTSPQEYDEYMDAFIGSGGGAGGLYLEDIATLYTFDRTPQQSRFSLQELLQHEFGHYLQGRYVFPGFWSSAGYHDEPKGWADEGMAEFLAGLVFDANGESTAPRRPVHMASLCRSPFRDLPSLIRQREGYNQSGSFDYAHAWAFVYYLMTERKPIARALYLAYRTNSYRVDNFSLIASVSIGDLENSWHTALHAWCSVSDESGAPRIIATPLAPGARAHRGRTHGTPRVMSHPIARFSKSVLFSPGSILITQLRDAQGQVVNHPVTAFLPVLDGNALLLRGPDGRQPLELGSHAEYRIVLTTAIVDSLGNAIERARTIQFTTTLDPRQQHIVADLDRNQVRVMLPQGTFSQEGYVIVNPLHSPNDPPVLDPEISSKVRTATDKLRQEANHSSVVVPQSTYEFVALQAQDGGVQDLQRPATIILPYPVGGVSGALVESSPEIPRIAWLNPVTATWQPLSSQVDRAQRLVTAQVNLLGVFTLIGSHPPAISAIFAFPVPFQPGLDSNHRTITFANTPKDTILKIFTVVGELVRELTVPDDTGQVVWDVTNSAGERVASDVYLYVAEKGGERKTGKLVVIR